MKLKLPYRDTFTTPFEQHQDREGQHVAVLDVIDRPDAAHDGEVLPMFNVRFDDGFETEAWPEEVLDAAFLSHLGRNDWAVIHNGGIRDRFGSYGEAAEAYPDAMVVWQPDLTAVAR